MRRTPDSQVIRRAASTLGLDLAGLEELVRTAEDAHRATAELHTRVKRRYRELAKQFHPDMAGDHDRMVAITEAKDILLGVRMILRQAPQVTITVSNPGFTTSNSSFDLWISIMQPFGGTDWADR